jgi:RimJ/RimL family protein N-acetyltransferase
MRHIAFGQTWRSGKADGAFDGALAHWRNHGFGRLSISELLSGAWIGLMVVNYVGSQAAEISANEVSIGWWLIRSAWGRGYATEGATAARDSSFEDLGLDRLIALLGPGNVRSARVAEKIGMHLERDTVGASGESL